MNDLPVGRACPYPGCTHEVWGKPLTCLLHWMTLSIRQQCRLHHLAELYRLGSIDVLSLYERQQRVLDEPCAESY